MNEHIKAVLDHTAERWGVVVEMVELKDIELPTSMQRAMAKEAGGEGSASTVTPQAYSAPETEPAAVE